MNEKIFIRACMLYEFDRGHSPSEAAHNIQKTYGMGTTSYSSVRRWFCRFQKGNRSLDDEEREGRPQTIDDDELKAAVEQDPFLTSRELGEMFDCSHTAILKRLEAIGKVNKRGRWLPHNLSVNNKIQRVSACSSLLSQLNRVGFSRFWDSFVTSDEKWIVYDNSGNQNQWLDRDQAPIGVPKPSQFQKKVMLCVWWSIHGIIHFELLNSGQTVDSVLYCEQLDRVNRALVVKGFDLRNIRFLHDNAKPHVSMMTQGKLEELGWEVLPHAPYSPDLAPSDYHLFRSMQHSLRGKKFKNNNEIQKWLIEFFDSKPPEFYDRGIKDLRRRWRETIAHDGEYSFD